MNEEILDDAEWDLAEVVSERDQPTDVVVVYLDETASFRKARLMEKHFKTVDADELKAIDDELNEVDRALKAKRYELHLTAVPSRMRDDINTKAFVKFPIKRDILGNEEAKNQLDRLVYEQDLVWHAQIIDVVNPDGRHRRNWTFEEMEAFAHSLPTAAQKIVDDAIKKLQEDAQKYTTASMNPDF